MSESLNSFLSERLLKPIGGFLELKIIKGFTYGLNILGLFLITTSCQPNAISFNSFESEQWIQESTTCKNYRSMVIDQMEAEFEKFMGMNETEVVNYLGKPDETLLYTRGQKFFNYQLDCKDKSKKTYRLRIRFSALDYVNEVLILD